MTFYEWLKNYPDVDSPGGNVAHKAKTDPNFPKDAVTKREVAGYLLYCKHVDGVALDSLDDAWHEFKESLRAAKARL
jgi:uncharacterized protein YozE (UPF0346 family)